MRPVVLVIAGSDSSGGAGLVRDVQVLTQLGCDARCAVTAVTAQTDTQVAAVHHAPGGLVSRQILAALHDGAVAAIKIGMLGTREIIEAVADVLPSRDQMPIVLDPVLASSSGCALLEPSAFNALREHLMPRATLVTPNVPESALLLKEAPASDEHAMIDQAERLLALGPEAVLVKGGHVVDCIATDILITRACGRCIPLRAERVVGARLRGTGCSLSSAIAAYLARGASLSGACASAKSYVLARLRDAHI